MKRNKIISLIILVIVMGIGGIIIRSLLGGGDAVYQFTEITRGDLENTISSSGTLSPVTTVDVGTQVSGTIAKVNVDFNDRVHKGQLMAVLDTVLLEAAVLDAQAGVEEAEAKLDEAQAEYDRNLPLFEKEYISESEFLRFKIDLKTRKAVLKRAQASLKRANRNLNYAYIYSPINGIVVARNVEEGQTVAASFATPTLFQIAEDLSRMEILVQVDESDIGLVKEGQKVRFEVQAYSDKIFEGTVNQIRLQPRTISNVVNYTVAVNASNDENLLLPGMTATVDFIIEQKKDVLLVAKAALNFRPSSKKIMEFRKRMQKKFNALPDEEKKSLTGKMRNPSRQDELPEDAGQLWYLDKGGNLSVEPVKIGASDGTKTEIVMCRRLKEGMRVISGIADTEKKKKIKKTLLGGPSGPGGPRR